MTNSITQRQKRLKRLKNAFFNEEKRINKKRLSKSGRNGKPMEKSNNNGGGGGTRTRVNLVMSQGWIRLQSRRIDTAKIHSLHGCLKSQDPKRPIFLFFLFFLENKSIYRSLLYTFFSPAFFGKIKKCQVILKPLRKTATPFAASASSRGRSMRQMSTPKKNLSKSKAA